MSDIPKTILESNNKAQYLSTLQNINFSHAIAKEPKKLDVNAFNFFRHTDEKHQILIFLSGDCRMDTDDYSHVLQPGDVCFNPAFSYYGVTILDDSPYERVVISIPVSERFDALAYEIFDDLKPINVDVKGLLLPFIERYKNYHTALPINQFSALANNLIEELLYICLMQKQSKQPSKDPSEAFLRKALEYIDLNWKNIKNITEISNALFISPSYLYEIFNTKLNITPKTYLTQKRLQAAHAYLVSGVAPNEVSRLVGFSTYTAFYRAFKAFYGKTPKEVFDLNTKK